MELTMCKSWMLYGAVSRGLCFTLFPINATERWESRHSVGFSLMPYFSTS